MRAIPTGRSCDIFNQSDANASNAPVIKRIIWTFPNIVALPDCFCPKQVFQKQKLQTILLLVRLIKPNLCLLQSDKSRFDMRLDQLQKFSSFSRVSTISTMMGNSSESVSNRKVWI